MILMFDKLINLLSMEKGLTKEDCMVISDSLLLLKESLNTKKKKANQ